MAKWILAIFGTQLCSVLAAVRSLPERVEIGECIDTTAGDVALYPSKISGFPAPDVAAAEGDISAALVSVAYGRRFKVLTEKLSKEQYVLTQCDTSQPTDEEVDAVVSGAGYQRKHFSVPIQRATAASTTILAFLRRLGVEDRVVYADSNAVHACWQKALSCGSVLESSWGNATLREQQLNDVEVVFMDCSGDCSNVRGRSNAVHVPATKDNGNLHSAEYIKFLAAFFNLEELALQSFQTTVASYMARRDATGPLVAWISWNGWPGYERFELSQASYRLQLVTAAGGRNVNASQVALTVASMASEDIVAGNPAAGKTYYIPAGNDKAAAATALLGALQDVDIIVDETYAPVPGDYNYNSFLSTFHLTDQSTQKFLSKVLRVDGILSANNGLDWFESRVAYPDMAATGLSRYVKDDATLAGSYFRNLAANEMPQIITAEMCDTTLPSCTQSYATPINLRITIETSAASLAMLSIPLLGMAWL